MIFNWRYFQTKSPIIWASSLKISSFFVAPGKPTDLRIASVRDLTITLNWKRPLTNAGAPDSSVLSYSVFYQASGGSRSGVNFEESLLSTENNYHLSFTNMHYFFVFRPVYHYYTKGCYTKTNTRLFSLLSFFTLFSYSFP